MMTKKQTQCPECKTVYNITVLQLTAAQGMVCCPKCSTSFDAITQLIPEQKKEDLNTTEDDNNSKQLFGSNVDLEIFNRKVPSSNIDLTTYLNNLNYFSSEPIQKLQALNLDEKFVRLIKKRNNPSYYFLWGLSNILILMIIMFILIIYHPNFIISNSFLNPAYQHICELLNCETIDQQYEQLETSNVQIKTLKKQTTTLITGELINRNPNSLPLPRLNITLFSNGERIFTDTFEPEEYLVRSFAGISRIPQNSPFDFYIYLPVERNQFNDYKIKILKP